MGCLSTTECTYPPTSPIPDCPPSGRAAGAHYPLAVGARGCGRGDPSQTPQRALLRAGFARCGGGMRVPGGAPPAWVWGVQGRALSHPRLPALWAGCRGPLPTGCGCGGVRAWGPVTIPTARALSSWLCALWGRHEGARGGAPPAWVWGVRCRALSRPRLPALWAGCRGPLPTCCGCGGGAGVGTCHQPHSACSFELALRAVGAARGRLGGGASCLGVGRPGSGTLPPPTARPPGGLPGPTTHWLWVRGGAGVGTRHQPHSARSFELALRAVGAARGRLGGGRLLPGCGASGVGRSPSPHCPPSGRAVGAHCPLAVGAGGVRAWGPVTNPTAGALARWLCALWWRHEGARGGASCLGVGRPGSGALPPPTARHLRGLPGPTTHWLWVRGVAGVGTRHQHHSARSFEVALHAVGAARGRPGGGASCLGVGRPGSGALPPPTARPLGGLPGPTTHWLWVRGGAGVGTRHQPHSARSFELALRAMGAARGRPGGGRLLPGCGASGVVHSPDPECQPSGQAAGAHYPLAVGAGGCGRGDLSQTPQRALASWLCALWGRHEGARGGASCLGVGRPGSGTLPPPTARPLGGLPGPTTHWLWVRGGAGVGTRHQPHSARSFELALHAVGAARVRLGGGASCLGVGHPVSGALPPPTARPLGGLPGPTADWLWVRGGCGRGDPSQTQQRALLRGGFARCGGGMRVPGGAPLAWVWGVRGRALSHPRLPALWDGCRGPIPTGCRCGGVRAWGPVTNPTAGALSSWLCALWGRQEGALGGGRLLPGCGASGVGRSPGPDCPPSGRAAGAHYPLAVGAGGCGRGDLSQTPQRALLRAGFARCGGGMRVPGGGASCLGVGRPGSGALPPPTARPLGGLLGPTTHWLWVRGGAGVGTRHQPHSARSFELALRAVGAARGRPGGRLLPGCGASGVGRSPTTDCPPSGRAARAHYALAVGAWGCGRGDPSPTPQRALFRAGFARCAGSTRAPGGARLLPGCGASGVGRSPTPDCRPSGRAAGAHYPLAVGAGGCGRGDPSPTPQRALLRAGFARCGSGMIVPGGAPLAWVWGVRGRALSHPRLPALWAGCRGPLPTGCGCAGVRAWGPVTYPTARALSSWLCALWGRCEGAWGGRPLPGCGASGVGRSPTPDCPPSGRAAGAHCPLAVGAWGCGRGDPSPTPQRALFRAGFARCGGSTRAPGGARLLPGCGASGVGRFPIPDCWPSGRAAAAHYPLAVGAGGCGCGDPSQTPQRALLRAGFARCGGGMRVPGGAPLAWVWGVRGRALSHPRLPALWAGCRGPLPTGCG